MPNLATKLFLFFINCFIANYCFICETAGKNLCAECETLLCTKKTNCKQCGNRISKEQTLDVCGECLKKTPPFEFTFFVGHYDEYLQKMIKDLKFHEKLYLSRIMGDLLVSTIRTDRCNEEMPDCIIPVPLHKKRIRERGFNQALEIARVVSKKLHIPLDYQSCIRIKNTLPQSSIKAKERHENIKNAFAIKKEILYQHVAIIDDVMTTGNTVRELVGLLKKTGVKTIEIWCVAKT